MTGFALAGMLSGAGSFDTLMNSFQATLAGHPNVFGAEVFIIFLIRFAYYVTLMHFFAHVVIRCLWIGAIGLRSVMGPTDYEALDLAPTFKNFLLRRNGSFDNYIRNLDNIASLIFAVTFLLIAVMVSTYVSILLISLIIIGWLAIGDNAFFIISAFMLGIILSLLVFLYLLDFLTAGTGKKNENIARLYYPVYRFLGWLTLARLYRPFYYNLVSHPMGKKIILFLIPYLIITLMVFGFRLQPNTLFDPSNSEYSDEDIAGMAFSYSYADDRHPDDRKAYLILPSRQISGPVVEVRIPVQPRLEQLALDHCPDLEPINTYAYTVGGFESFFFGFSSAGYRDTLGNLSRDFQTVIQQEVLPCILAPLELKLDDQVVDLKQCLIRPPNQGDLFTELIVFVPLRGLAEGMHSFTLNQYRPGAAGAPQGEIRRYTKVPFYYVDERLGQTTGSSGGAPEKD